MLIMFLMLEEYMMRIKIDLIIIRKMAAGKRENGIEYASFGLVWRKFGIKLCVDTKVVDLVDKILVAPIDAGDNGFDLVENKHEISPYFIHRVFLQWSRRGEKRI